VSKQYLINCVYYRHDFSLIKLGYRDNTLNSCDCSITAFTIHHSPFLSPQFRQKCVSLQVSKISRGQRNLFQSNFRDISRRFQYFDVPAVTISHILIVGNRRHHTLSTTEYNNESSNSAHNSHIVKLIIT
jgi:hypothetical protein